MYCQLFSLYRAILIQNADLNVRINNIDSKINKVFKYLLDRIDALHQDNNKNKPQKIGYKK